MTNIELPRDASGLEIPLDTKVLYDGDGNAKEVQAFDYSPVESMWRVLLLGDFILFFTSDMHITPQDSWEKLEEDLDKETSKLKDAYMKLPLDADGVPIRIGDEVKIDGDAMTVLGYRIHNDMLLLVAKDKKTSLFFTPEPSRVRHFKPEPSDSWEKLLDDLDNAAKGGDNAECCYTRREGIEVGEQCPGCRLYEQGKDKFNECSYLAYADIAARIRKLRGEGE